MKKSTWLAMVIGGGFVALMAMFALGLKNNPNDLDLVTQGQKIPEFSLPSLLDDRTLTNADLTTEKSYYLLNFWGSWCPSCYQEHSYLKQLSQTVPIYGVNWKDSRADGQAFINKGGNPFRAIMVDDSSVLAIGLGVYGAPETYLLAADGTILYRHAGPINAEVWESELLPVIKTIGVK